MPTGKAGDYLRAFHGAMDDDLSTPRALAELWGLLRDTGLEAEEALRGAFEMDRILGFDLAGEVQRHTTAAAREDGDAGAIEALIAERGAAKKAKDFAKADQIRDTLKKRGIILEDNSTGTTWRRG
jgi:cysteinyl-tRNA synthetase